IPFRGRDWPRVIGSVLAPGGLVPTFDFQTPPDRALGFVGVEPTTYIGDPTPMTYRTTRHGSTSNFRCTHGRRPDDHNVSRARSAGVAALRCAGFGAARRDDRPVRDVESLVIGPDRIWRLRDGHPRRLLSFSLRRDATA